MAANAVTPPGISDGQTRDSPAAEAPKARKACINCRKQKMRCILGKEDSCRRCRRAGLPCIFVPRANAATLPADLLDDATDASFKKDVLHRLKVIEACLGLQGLAGSSQQLGPVPPADFGSPADEVYDTVAMAPLWEATAVLEDSCPPHVPAQIWQKATVARLWSSFHDRMPGLHFMPDKQTFSSPQPILLASMLYCSSTRGSPEMAEMAPNYFAVLCSAIAQLSVPGSQIGRVPEGLESAGEWAFQTVLGIVLAGLLTEANVRETGIWISVAYRLILEHCPPHEDDSTREWRRLFSGVQIVDLEHASLHLSCPVIPIEPPLPVLQTSPRDQLYRLSRMMHTGLSHYTGRRLPTIWSCFTDSPVAGKEVTSSFTAVDAAVIRDWARQLDEWLVEFSSARDGPELSRNLIFRQYVLHRLVVLSIYHPARGFNLWSRSTSPIEQHELLLSARATLKLHLHDDSIWSNWDLVMITWAALIVVQGIEGGAGEPEDLRNITVHLEMLKQMDEPKPSLCDKLISRLEGSLQGVTTPNSTTMVQYNEALASENPTSVDYPWQIFDQVSLQQFNYAM